MEGLLGLTKSINDRDSGVRELATLERMDQKIQKTRKEEVEAEQQQQLFYEQMYAEADKMLEKDRKNIRAQILKSQNTVRDHIAKFGGSKKDFMRQGGFSAMNDIKNGIIRSDEAMRYKDNKANLAKILEVKEKGLGHLLSLTDKKSLEDYENNENGSKITYGGLLSEVEIPPSQNFDYGTDIPIDKVLSYKGNLVKILANYKSTYPDAPELDVAKNKEDYLKVIAFAKEMGYGGTGSNTARLRAQAEQAKARSQYDKKTSTATKSKKNSVISNWTFAVSETPKVTAKDYLEGGAYSEKGLIETIKEKNPKSFYNQLLKDPSNLNSKHRTLSSPDEVGFFENPGGWFSEGIGEVSDFIFSGNVGLKESYEFMPMSSAAITKAVLASPELGYEIKDGKVLNYIPDEKTYRADGIKMTKGNKPSDFEKYKGDYKVKGVVTAVKGKGTDDDILFVNAYDSDGNIDKKTTDKMYEGLSGENGGSEGRLTTVIALENSEGDLFYKEVELTDVDVQTAITNAVGENDDITDAVSIAERQSQAFAELEKDTTEQQIQFQSAISGMEKTFESPIFKAEGAKYHGAGSGGQENRNDLMKAFYMAMDYSKSKYQGQEYNIEGNLADHQESITQLMDADFFTAAAVSGNIEDKLKDYSQGNSEEGIIMDWLDNTIQENKYEEGSLKYKQNADLANKWIQMLKLLNQG